MTDASTTATRQPPSTPQRRRARRTARAARGAHGLLPHAGARNPGLQSRARRGGGTDPRGIDEDPRGGGLRIPRRRGDRHVEGGGRRCHRHARADRPRAADGASSPRCRPNSRSMPATRSAR